MHDRNAFVTLTYNDEHLPVSGSLDTRHLQLFIKRLRNNFGSGIRFYACGEYGEKFLRPHYHLCLFNFYPPDPVLHMQREDIRLYKSETLDEIWGKGFTLTGEVTFDSAAYVARYIMKKITGKAAEDHYATPYEHVDPITGEVFDLTINRQPEFTNMSRRPGIGRDFYEKYKSDIFPHDHVILQNGKEVRPPRYYSGLFELEYPTDHMLIKRKRLARARKNIDDNTSARLNDKEQVQLSKLKMLPRNLETGD